VDELSRRGFLRLAGGAASLPVLAQVLAACGGTPGQPGAATASTLGAAATKVKLGFISLTDHASIVMAKELGYFAERGLDVTLEKQASWPVTRDNLLNGQIDGAHCLYSMPASVTTGVGGKGERGLRIAMMLNSNGQAITMAKALRSAGYADLDKAKAELQKSQATVAMTFPGGTHDLWIRYWLKSMGLDGRTTKIIPIPPAQMVANMEVGACQAYCVGEPWGAVAVQKAIGFTHITSQDIWSQHPEKALVVSERFAAQQPDALERMIGAILQASKWLDDLPNRTEASKVLGTPSYVNAPAAEIEGRLLGKYALGEGLPDKTYTDDAMRFFNGGKVNAPDRGHLIWAMAQYQRLGLLSEAPPAQEIADQLILRDVYEKAAAKEKVDVPDDMKPLVIKLDKTTFDPRKPAEEASRL
jgi:nitrate/nitrite transport system substrate-binding protein